MDHTTLAKGPQSGSSASSSSGRKRWKTVAAAPPRAADATHDVDDDALRAVVAAARAAARKRAHGARAAVDAHDEPRAQPRAVAEREAREANAAVGGRVESDERKRRTASGRACARAHLERSHAHKRLELRPHGVGQRRVLDHGAECGRRGAGAAAGAGATAALPNKATARTCARRLRPRPPLRGCGRTHLDEARGKMTAQRRPTPPPTITTSYIVRRNR